MICEWEISKIIFEYCRPSIVKYDGWFWHHVYDWQTLIAGSFALLGGSLLAWQIRIQKTEISRQKQREEIAARVKLPHALSDVHRYLEAIFDKWLAKDKTNKPQLSSETLDALAHTSSVTNKDTFVTLKNLITTLQSYDSQLDKPDVINYLDNMISGMSYILFLNTSLFAYGRFEVNSVYYSEPKALDLYMVLNNYFLYRYSDDSDEINRVKNALRLNKNNITCE